MEDIEFSSKTLHLAVQPTGSAPKFVLGSSSTSRSKLIHQNNSRRRHVLLAGMQDASKGIVAKDLETGNGAPA